jgi:hypothetical protein
MGVTDPQMGKIENSRSGEVWIKASKIKVKRGKKQLKRGYFRAPFVRHFSGK